MPDIAHDPMTGSDAEFLAEAYGYGSAKELAATEPPHAQIADFGSGLSNFGNIFGTLRPDARVSCVDIQYPPQRLTEARVLAQLKTEAPANVHYRWGNVLDERSLQGIRDLDAAFSYNLVTHLLRVRHAGRALARTALTNMLSTLKPEGTLYVGPTNSRMESSQRWSAITLTSTASNEDIENALDTLKSPPRVDLLYTAAAISGVTAYPRHRFAPHPTRRGALIKFPVILSNDAGQTQQEVLSWRGIALSARFAGGLIAAGWYEATDALSDLAATTKSRLR